MIEVRAPTVTPPTGPAKEAAKIGLSKGLAVFLVQVGTDYLDRLVAIYVVSLVYKALKSRMSLGVTKY